MDLEPPLDLPQSWSDTQRQRVLVLEIAMGEMAHEGLVVESDGTTEETLGKDP